MTLFSRVVVVHRSRSCTSLTVLLLGCTYCPLTVSGVSIDQGRQTSDKSSTTPVSSARRIGRRTHRRVYCTSSGQPSSGNSLSLTVTTVSWPDRRTTGKQWQSGQPSGGQPSSGNSLSLSPQLAGWTGERQVGSGDSLSLTFTHG